MAEKLTIDKCHNCDIEVEASWRGLALSGKRVYFVRCDECATKGPDVYVYENNEESELEAVRLWNAIDRPDRSELIRKVAQEAEGASQYIDKHAPNPLPNPADNELTNIVDETAASLERILSLLKSEGG